MEYLAVAILAGICPEGWPWRWPKRVPKWWPWPPRPPRPGPGDPDPIGPDITPSPEPWTAITGLLCGAGGAVAWLALGQEFGADGSLLAPVVIGFLGGTTAGWVVASGRDLSSSR